MCLVDTLTTRLGISIRILARHDKAERTLPGPTLLEVAKLYHLAETAPPAPDPQPMSNNKRNCNKTPTGAPPKLPC